MEGQFVKSRWTLTSSRFWKRLLQAAWSLSFRGNGVLWLVREGRGLVCWSCIWGNLQPTGSTLARLVCPHSAAAPQFCSHSRPLCLDKWGSPHRKGSLPGDTARSSREGGHLTVRALLLLYFKVLSLLPFSGPFMLRRQRLKIHRWEYLLI